MLDDDDFDDVGAADAMLLYRRGFRVGGERIELEDYNRVRPGPRPEPDVALRKVLTGDRRRDELIRLGYADALERRPPRW